MADTNSSLPIRTEADGTDQRVHVKIVDGTNPSINQAKVDSDNNLHVLSAGHDPGGTQHPVRTSEQGALTPDGIYNAASNTKPGNVGAIVSVRSAAPNDTTQTVRVTGVQGANPNTVWAQDISLHDHGGSPYTPANPLPVSIQNSSGGAQVFDFKDAASIAPAASDNHDYTVTNTKTLSLKQVLASSSGKCKCQVQVSTDGITFNTLAVAFNSSANPNISINMSEYRQLVGNTTAKVRVIMTNLENSASAAQDLYSTIIGEEN